MRRCAKVNSNRPTPAKEEEVTLLLESVFALESRLDILVTRVDDFNRRLGKAEVRLAEIAKIGAEHD